MNSIPYKLYLASFLSDRIGTGSESRRECVLHSCLDRFLRLKWGLSFLVAAERERVEMRKPKSREMIILQGHVGVAISFFALFTLLTLFHRHLHHVPATSLRYSYLPFTYELWPHAVFSISFFFVVFDHFIFFKKIIYKLIGLINILYIIFLFFIRFYYFFHL